MIAFVWNDLVKSATLGATVVATLACAAWRVGGALRDAPPTRSGKVVEIQDGRAAAKPLAAKRATFDPDLERGEPTVADPFRPLVPETPAPTAEPLQAPTPLAGALAPLPSAPAGVSAAIGSGGTPDASGSPMRVTPPVRLTGVVVGSRPTAIVRVGEEEFVVRPGGRLPDGSEVVGIERTGVTLVRGSEKSRLPLTE